MVTAYCLAHPNGLDGGDCAFVNQLTCGLEMLGAIAEHNDVDVVRFKQSHQFYTRAEINIHSPIDMLIEPGVFRESLVHVDVLLIGVVVHLLVPHV
jgi:hypothetical protein